MLKLVTITGADDKTNVEDLRQLSDRFPFVEWGILIGDVEDTYRFPSTKWMQQLADMTGVAGMNISTHMCGHWVKKLLLGQLDFRELPPVWQISKRAQINTHGEIHKTHARFVAEMSRWTKEFIFQLDGVNDHLFAGARGYCLTMNNDSLAVNTSGLFDLSHGAGMLPNDWPKSSDWRGYAGGLSAENVIDQVKRIAHVASYFWIDMETKVRTDNNKSLDLNKVESVLNQCAPYIDRHIHDIIG